VGILNPLLISVADCSRLKGAKLKGIIYVHSISDSKVSQSIMNDIKELRNEQPNRSFIVATTMWNCVSKDVALERERELRGDTALLRAFSDAGVKFISHPGTTSELESAHAIIRSLLYDNPARYQSANTGDRSNHGSRQHNDRKRSIVHLLRRLFGLGR
jgi:hypothetical protein